MTLFTNGSFKALRASIACDLIHAPCEFRIMVIKTGSLEIYKVICLTSVPTISEQAFKFSYIPMDNYNAIWLKDDNARTDMILFIPKDIKFLEYKITGKETQFVHDVTQGKAHIIEAANDVCKKFQEEVQGTEVVELKEGSVLHQIIPLSFSESRESVTNHMDTEAVKTIHSYLEKSFCLSGRLRLC